MNLNSFIKKTKILYKNAKNTSFKHKGIVRCKGKTISADIEDYFAKFLYDELKLSNRNAILISPKVFINKKNFIEPDILIVDVKSKKICCMLDIKCDIGYYSNSNTNINRGTSYIIVLNEHKKSYISLRGKYVDVYNYKAGSTNKYYAIDQIFYDIVFLNTRKTKILSKYLNKNVWVLSSGSHPNSNGKCIPNINDWLILKNKIINIL